jgi:hypothetical protein
MNAKNLECLVSSGLNKKSLANNSTSPISIRIPVDIEFRAPEQTIAVNEPLL